MKQTRREFLLTTAVAAGGAVAWSDRATASAEPTGEPLMYAGDPYLATLADGALGGSFNVARERAARFRSTDADRDRLVLGLED